MPARYTAFLSYAHRYKPWVKVLQRNLEACFATVGRLGKVFLDDLDIASGRSWVTQLQAALDRSDALVLVATPEALASPRVSDEWQSLLAVRRDWQAGLHIAKLVKSPLPPFLEAVQRVDFTEAREEKYRRGLQELVVGLLGTPDRRDLPVLPLDLEIPPPPDPGLPPALRAELIEWLAPFLARKTTRLAIASRLHLVPEKLERQPSKACAASAALVWATGDEAPVPAALRIIDTLQEILGDEEPARVAELDPLREKLSLTQQETSEGDSLAVWLRRVAEDHRSFMPLQEQAELGRLDRVYVQLDLQREGLDRPIALLELLALYSPEFPWAKGPWVILGDPGAGKTTLLRNVTVRLARQSDRSWVPLYESLPRLLRDEEESFLDRAVRRLQRSGDRVEGLKETLVRMGKDGRLLLLFDGLDEVPEEYRNDAEQFLRDLVERWPETPLIVTSRPIGYRKPASYFGELVLLPFDRSHQLEFLARWFGRAVGKPDEARAEEALSALDSPELRELAGNPLYLTLMAMLFEQGIEPDRNRPRLYDQILFLLIQGKHRPAEEPIAHPVAVRRALGYLAYSLTVDGLEAEPVDLLQHRLYQPGADFVYRMLERVPHWCRNLRHFFDDVAEKTAVLGPHDGPDRDWRFWHRTFREALVAESLEEEFRSKKGRAAILARARKITVGEDQSRWAEPFALLVGRVEDPENLMRALAKENRQLALRALATAQSLNEDAFREILSISGDHESRARIYQQLPQLLGEPRRSLALIDQLRRRTRNGNDLFFLDLTAQKIGERYPAHAREVAQLRTRFYDHIPLPAEDLFQWINTPMDGRVALWREIQPGQFRMGSSKDQRSTSELLRHEVSLQQAFRLGAVTVTNAQYGAFDPYHPSALATLAAEEISLQPVRGINWFEAVSFCRWLSSAFPWTRGARLPTEEEWEYACRAGTSTLYWSGDTSRDLWKAGWFSLNSGGQVHRVGEKLANPWGLYDVHGNVWEWTLSSGESSPYDRNPRIAPQPDEAEFDRICSEERGGTRVLRGGSCRGGDFRACAAYRFFEEPGLKLGFEGLRVLLPTYRA